MTSKLPTMHPIWSDSVVDALGVNVHYGFNTTVYGNTNAVTNYVKLLGARHVRDRMIPQSQPQRDAFADLASYGIRAHVSLGKATDLPMTVAEMNSLLTPIRLSPATYSSVSNVNEPQQVGGWVQKVVDHQRLISECLTGAGLHTARVGPALQDAIPTMDADYVAVAKTHISDYLDYGDFHRYPLSGNTGNLPTPSSLVDDRLAKSMSAYKHPSFWTEGGFNTGMKVVGAGNPIPEDLQALYTPKMWFEAVLRNIKRVFIYELLDDPDELEWESNFGLVNCPSLNPVTWEAKPVFAAIAHLASELSDRGPVVTPTPVKLRVSTPLTVRKLLVGKRSGEVTLYLWQDVANWDKASNKRVAAPVVQAHIERPKKSWTVSIGEEIVAVPVRKAKGK